MLLTVAHAQSLQSCLVLCNCMAVACQASLSMKFSRQESWSKLPYPSPEYILNPRSKPVSLTSPVLVGGFFTTSATNCSIQSLSCVRLSVTPWTATHQTSLSITNSQSLLKLMSIVSVMPSSHLILSRPLLLPPILASIRVFSKESALRISWPKYWSFSFSISPSNEYAGLISFKMDWLDFLAVQGTLKSLLQHHSSKASVLRCLALFMIQPSHP